MTNTPQDLIRAVSHIFAGHHWTVDIAESFAFQDAPCWAIRLRIAPKDRRRSHVDTMIASASTKEQAIGEAIDSLTAWRHVLKL